MTTNMIHDTQLNMIPAVQLKMTKYLMLQNSKAKCGYSISIKNLKTGNNFANKELKTLTLGTKLFGNTNIHRN